MGGLNQVRQAFSKARAHQREGFRSLVLASYGFFHQRLNFLYNAYVRLRGWYYRAFKRRSFSFRGETYSYYYHPYNLTFTNERALEIPIAWKLVRQNTGARILEVGNVLSHYFPVSHDVVDKYEKGHCVFNQDIVDFRDGRGYDLILSISTIEHVGWDSPEERNPEKAIQALDSMRRLCRPDGMILVTWGLGYNRAIDRMIAAGRLAFDDVYFFKKVSKDNLWRETAWEEVSNSRFGRPYKGANGLIVGFIHCREAA